MDAKEHLSKQSQNSIKCIKLIIKVTIGCMDAFLALLSLIFSHNATALLLQIMNRLAQKSIHSGFTFVFKQPLNIIMENKELDRISYALGLSMGNNFRASGIQEINVEDFADGVAAVFYGSQPKMTYDEAKAEIQKYFTALEEKQRAEAAKMADVNAAAGKQFLEENGKRVEVKTTASGLQYEVLQEGDGEMPTAQDQVEVHYTGKLIDGTVFDSSVERGVPATFGVTQVIPGWVEALQLMKAGSKWRLFIPSQLAYGPQGAGGLIGPNSTLIFDVELLKVIKK